MTRINKHIRGIPRRLQRQGEDSHYKDVFENYIGKWEVQDSDGLKHGIMVVCPNGYATFHQELFQAMRYRFKMRNPRDIFIGCCSGFGSRFVMRKEIILLDDNEGFESEWSPDWTEEGKQIEWSRHSIYDSKYDDGDGYYSKPEAPCMSDPSCAKVLLWNRI